MRTLLRFFFSAMGLMVASALVPGIRHGAFLDLLVVAALLGLLNATLGSALKLLAFIPMACSLGCLGLLINGLVFWLAGALSGPLGLAFRVDGFWAGVLGALVSSLVAWLLERTLMRREEPKGPPPPRRIKVVN